MGTYNGDSGDNSFVGGAESDQANGNGGNDTLIGLGGDDTLDGGDGDDTLDGGDDDDLLIGGAGKDTLRGGNGHDIIFSHNRDPNYPGFPYLGVPLDTFSEADILQGGAGNDTIFAGYGDSVDGGGNEEYGDKLNISFLGAPSAVSADFRLLGTQTSITIGGATITGIEEVSYIEGSNFDDLLAGWAGSFYPTGNWIYGRGGNDRIIAGYYAGWAGSRIYGGDGNDEIDLRGAGYSPNAYGEAGNDYIIGGSSYEYIDGGDGDDALEGNYGYDTLLGGNGNDIIDGGTFGDALSGGAGDDTLYGAGDADIIEGNEGDDLIYGDYSLISSAGGLSPASNDDNLKGGAGNDRIYGDQGNDVLDGGADADELRGGAGSDSLSGGSGNDILDGGDGDDTGYGGDGDDLLISGSGTDQLTGEEGSDRFYFAASFGGSDIAAGGSGADELILQGNYSSGLAIGAANLVGIETVRLLSAQDASFGGASGGSSFGYNLTFVDAIVAAGATLTINAAGLAAGEAIQLDASAETNGRYSVVSGAGDDRLTGGAGSDFLDLSKGGTDTAFGGAGDDGFIFGASFTAADKVDGGAGLNDQVALQGDYSAGLTLGAESLVNVETLLVLPGFDYRITAIDANVSAGGRLQVFGTTLGAGDNLTFDGSAETNGYFVVYGGGGVDTVTGGLGNDGFYFGPGNFTGQDVLHGGAGNNDQLGLDGHYSMTLGGNFDGIETLVLYRGPSSDLNKFNLVTTDAVVAAGQRFTVFGTTVGTDIVFNGSAENDGSFRFLGGQGNDSFTGGKGDDLIFGAGGGDTLSGGGGNDLFLYNSIAESTAASFDKILSFGSGDRIDLSGIDANGGTPENDAFAYIGSDAFSGAAGQLRLFQANGGWTIEGDTNGDKVADLMISVTTDAGHIIVPGDFMF